MTEVRAKKALGQHFLVDLNIARKICQALSGGACPEADAARGLARTAGKEEPAGAGAGKGGGVNTGISGSDPGPAGDVRSGGVNPGTHGPDRSAARCENCSGGEVAGSGECLDAGAAGAGAWTGAEPEPRGKAGKCVDSDAESSAAGTARCDVLEVGCGMGVLTQFLLQRDDITLWGAEIDSESVEYLHAHYPQFKPRLIEGDFLGMDLRTMFPRGVRIIGNFPYNISSQIFFKVLENRDLIPECVGMIQREVAVRLAESPGSKEYGILSVLLQAWYDIEYLFTVGESVFNPPPKVKSAVVRLRRNATVRLGCDERLFVRVVKASFGQRRKMIRNALRAAFGDFAGAEHPFFTRRAEQLSVADFVELTRWVADHIR